AYSRERNEAKLAKEARMKSDARRRAKVLVQIGRRDLGDPGAVIALVTDRTLAFAHAPQKARDAVRRDSFSRTHRARDLLARDRRLLARAVCNLHFLVRQSQVRLGHPRSNLGCAVERVLDIALAGQHVAGGKYEGRALHQQAD